jgi:hypothetical protein
MGNSMGKSRKIQPVRLVTLSLPDYIAAELDKEKRGKKSELVAKLLERHFAEKGAVKPQAETDQPEQEEVVKGLKREDVLKKVEEYVLKQFQAKTDDIDAKKAKARKDEDYGRLAAYNKMLYNKENGLYEGGQERWFKEITIKEVEAALGLPYQTIYNKILPILLNEGYQVVPQRFI